MISPVLKSQLKVKWSFLDDQMAEAYISNVSTNAKIVVPREVMRDENYYRVRVNVSNYDGTYSRIREIRFVPINC